MNSKLEIAFIKKAAGINPFDERLKQFKKVGRREYEATCPWHSDAHPSFAISEKDPGIYLWRCRSQNCKGGGDVLKFVMEFDKVSFPPAKELVAKSGGIVLTEEPPPVFAYDPAAASVRIGEAETYLTSRGISIALARERGVGVVDYPRLGLSIAIPYGDGVVKLRALQPKDKAHKFRHLEGHPSDNLLYGLGDLEDTCFTTSVVICESELDCLTLQFHDINAVSVSSATTVLDKGNLKLSREALDALAEYDHIYLGLDADEAGQKCAGAFERALPPHKTHRLTWNYGGKESGDPKDIGDLFQKDPSGFQVRIEELCNEALARPPRPPEWRKLFRSRAEMEGGDIKFLIKSFLPEGVTFLGGLSGCGKTWFALSLAKALTTGKKFLGLFDVPEATNVLYLVPEAGERSFRKRLETLGINERFLCRTMQDGIVSLNDPELLAAVRHLKPVVFLDTAIRFSTAGDENSAAENRALVNAIFALRTNGAQAIVGLHHSPKASAKVKILQLENTLRGTGDLGAMCDCVYALKCGKEKTFEVTIYCVKARDFEPVGSFHIQGRPFINETGDFGVLVEPQQALEQAEVDRLVAAIQADPNATWEKLSTVTNISEGRIGKVAAKAGWIKPRHQAWICTNLAGKQADTASESHSLRLTQASLTQLGKVR